MVKNDYPIIIFHLYLYLSCYKPLLTLLSSINKKGNLIYFVQRRIQGLAQGGLVLFYQDINAKKNAH